MHTVWQAADKYDGFENLESIKNKEKEEDGPSIDNDVDELVSGLESTSKKYFTDRTRLHGPAPSLAKPLLGSDFNREYFAKNAKNNDALNKFYYLPELENNATTPFVEVTHGISITWETVTSNEQHLSPVAEGKVIETIADIIDNESIRDLLDPVLDNSKYDGFEFLGEEGSDLRSKTTTHEKGSTKSGNSGNLGGFENLLQSISSHQKNKSESTLCDDDDEKEETAKSLDISEYTLTPTATEDAIPAELGMLYESIG
ncbi:hypothetical protein AX774_g2650 [Zancudomyces culisetae]|uniref:Uncharacterized protein n=1 Tax=Zancudomyces culisetae TaxID=1213189 RepID=A0A1R1PS79_ZANCU|nr:hypothetical protein AX774_g2650 [Zancudomyces culisetae]|eukprot:OMH83840.1 hypothetical protein AX774_g2650 [Zancudomyces culisetae]